MSIEQFTDFQPSIIETKIEEEPLPKVEEVVEPR